MNIACPICDASYEVPEAVLAAHRPLRCARCGHDWIPGQAAPEPEPVEPEPPAPLETRANDEPMSEPEPEFDEFAAADEPETITEADVALAVELVDEPPPEPAVAAPASPILPRPIAPRPTLPPPPPTPVQPRAAWIASLVVLAALIAALLIFQASIIRAWPPMAHLYALFGM